MSASRDFGHGVCATFYTAFAESGEAFAQRSTLLTDHAVVLLEAFHLNQVVNFQAVRSMCKILGADIIDNTPCPHMDIKAAYVAYET